MAVSDQTILSQIQRVTLENTGDGGVQWPSGMWTQAEVLGYLNQRQNRFLAYTALMWTVRAAGVTTGQAEQAAPTDWAATIFLAYGTSTGEYSELPRLSVQELDYWQPTWPGASSLLPKGYYETEGETLTTYLAPIPTDVGSVLERYYVALGTTLTAAGVSFSVPDEFVATIKYGVLADMFRKVGQAQNLTLSQRCEQRWREGVELGRLIALEGWLAI